MSGQVCRAEGRDPQAGVAAESASHGVLSRLRAEMEALALLLPGVSSPLCGEGAANLSAPRR